MAMFMFMVYHGYFMIYADLMGFNQDLNVI